ncbi:MAG: ribonuclease HII [Bdellovibrionales bacterium]|nr:ribonuclease HII [Bdellovibrionales bacterium]
MNRRKSKRGQARLFIVGADEAGRGPLAGPVTGAAVILPPGYVNSGINDSKKLSAEQRCELAAAIRRDALAWAVYSVGPRRIEHINILQAARLAMARSVDRVHRIMGGRYRDVRLFVLVDGNVRLETKWPQETMVKGDGRMASIGAASILAKVVRDELMALADVRYPQYGFRNHKGYATHAHRQALAEFGYCRLHRRSFAGVCLETGSAQGEEQAELF